MICLPVFFNVFQLFTLEIVKRQERKMKMQLKRSTKVRRESEGIDQSRGSNSRKSSGAVNRRAVDFPRGHVHLCDFTMDRAPTQGYIQCQVPLNGLRVDGEISKANKE